MDGTAVRLLIEAGANVNIINKLKETALHLVVQEGHADVVVTRLKRSGANLDAQDINGKTALHIAVLGNHSEIADTLIKEGADVDAKDKYGRTALHLAVLGNHSEIADTLIKAGADVNAKDIYGQTARQLAKKFCPEGSKVLEKTDIPEGSFRLKLRKSEILITISEEEETQIFSPASPESSSPWSIGLAASPVFTKKIVKQELAIGLSEENGNNKKAKDSLSNVAKTLAEIIGAGFAGVNKAVPTGYAERAAASEGPEVKGCSIS